MADSVFDEMMTNTGRFMLEDQLGVGAVHTANDGSTTSVTMLRGKRDETIQRDDREEVRIITLQTRVFKGAGGLVDAQIGEKVAIDKTDYWINDIPEKPTGNGMMSLILQRTEHVRKGPNGVSIDRGAGR